jgi:hypothetical protein
MIKEDLSEGSCSLDRNLLIARKGLRRIKWEVKMSSRSVIALCLFAVTILVMSNALSAGEITKIKISDAMKGEVLLDPAFTPGELGVGIPLRPGLALTSPGSLVGTTHYDYQDNGSAGNRLVKESKGTIHIAWMNGVDFWTGDRWIYYNFRSMDGEWAWPYVGTQVNNAQGAGYTQLSIMSDGRAAPAYHSTGNNLYTCMGLDILRGFGCFTELDVRDDGPGSSYYVWPYETIDRNDRIHIVSYENSGTGTPQRAIYTRSDDEGKTWIAPELWDSLMAISGVLTSSRISDKVCIAYTHPRDLEDPNQYNDDMCYYESLDGVTWNFNGGMINVTNYQISDTLRAYCHVDAVYDWNDDLHLIWITPYYDEIGGRITTDACLLWHWSEANGITMVANGWWPSSPGAWNRTISQISIGVDETNALFCLWTQFTEEDKSAGGYSNGELYMNYSTDGGSSWTEPENLTNSPSPGCLAGECDSDHWPTLNETADDSLYLTYINDKDAGGIPQSEGLDTENPVMYLAVRNPLMVGVEEEDSQLPVVASLEQNYPNPFNTSTNIGYALEEPGEVRLEVYDISGRLVATLVDGHQEAGEHTVAWDGSSVSSGVYFCTLKTGEFTDVRKMNLLK